jgi:pyruvate/2-oxoglutarate dehydrogenase complex dihydrolipoamide acyltransferase (E2) component
VTERQTEALERLNQGIQESRREVQQRTMNLAQEYFGDSAEMLKQNIRENRATLEGLPDQIPGGREEAFQAFFQQLMDNYGSMEECINEAQQNVANLDTDQIRRQGEIEATDAARREARERGVDLTKVEGTGSDGRIIVSDVVEVAETMEEGSASEVAQGAQDAAGQAADQAGQVAGQAKDAAGGAAQQAQDTAGQATDQVGQAANQAQDAAGGVTQQAAGGDEGPKATNAARRRAEQMGLDLSTIKGTGSGGLITIKDVTGS